MCKYHLRVGGMPWCSWTSCAAGRDIAQQANVLYCDAPSAAEASRRASRLRPYFVRGAVKVVSGDCPAANG